MTYFGLTPCIKLRSCFT